MTKLKTLKDLRRQPADRYGICDYCIEKAKQEAIKWVKKYGYYRMLLDRKVYAGNMREFRKFFNITEEDLK